MDRQFLQQLVDAIFAYAESKVAGHPFLVSVLEQERQLIDTAGLDALLAWLGAKGLTATSPTSAIVDGIFAWLETLPAVAGHPLWVAILKAVNAMIDAGGFVPFAKSRGIKVA